MKKIIVICVILLMSCVGFSAKTKSAVDSPDISSIKSTENQAIKEEDTLIPSMKNQDIYMTCQNWDLDLYDVDNLGSGFHFAIYSHEPLNPEEIDIIIPIDAKYTFEIENKKDWTISSKMPLYLYQACRGLDWKQGGLLYQKMQLAKERKQEVANSTKWSTTEKEAEQREMDIIIKASQRYLSAYKTDYNKLQESDFPKFYQYFAFVVFENGWEKEEKLEEIKVRVGEKTYIQNIGEVRLNKLKQENISIASVEHMRNEDIAEIELIMCVGEEKEDLVLNRIYVEDDDVTLVNAEVGKLCRECYAYSNGTKQERLYTSDEKIWDMVTPMHITDMEEIVIKFELQESRLKQFEYHISVPVILEYTYGQEKFVVKNIVSIQKRNDAWDTCAAAFYGVDIMDYYIYYKPDEEPKIKITGYQPIRPY